MCLESPLCFFSRGVLLAVVRPLCKAGALDGLRRPPRMVSPSIQKKRRPPKRSLIGRRVQVPQEVFGLSDDDGSAFFFAGTIKEVMAQRMLIRFDYTGEEEWHASTLVARWLEKDLDPLIQQLSSVWHPER